MDKVLTISKKTHMALHKAHVIALSFVPVSVRISEKSL